MANSERLELWKQRLEENESAYDKQLQKMDEREQRFRGTYTFADFSGKTDDPHSGQEVKYVYNALAENIEAQVSSDIPMPKVTARRKKDEHLAVVIENMIRNELDRMPMEELNDLAERLVPIQGGGFYLVEWDNALRTHGTVGELAVSFVHPKQLIPQAGVYSKIEDMDYFILKRPTTKAAVLARYGVDVAEEDESEPEVKDASDGDSADDMVTQYIAYYRNERGGIGVYSWVNETELVDIEDYQARRLPRCAQCGAAEPMEGELVLDGEEYVPWHEGDACPVCGARDWQETEEAFEEVPEEILTARFGDLDGGVTPETDAELLPGGVMPEDVPQELSGRTVPVPYYKPDRFPLVLQRNVSVFGQLLGDSDVDKQASMQDGINRLEQKIFDRMLRAGSKISLPNDPAVRMDPKDNDVIRVRSAADLAQIQMFNFTGNIAQELTQINAIYQQMRQIIGVTDSFQGRRDTTAISGSAKQFAAAQTAGRLESKRVMKQKAYAEIFELMFKFRLAYADEPRPVVYQDPNGDTVYDTFDRWDFLERDESGAYWWNDQFLFGCDTTAPLASNRERLWQETTSFLTAGAFGDPTQPETLIAYWRKMELLHYPGAAETRKTLEERAEEQRAAVAAQQMQQAQQPAVPDADVDGMARQAAMEQAAQEAAAAQAFSDAGGGMMM